MSTITLFLVVVEHGQSSKFKKTNNKGKGIKLGPKGGVSKKLKFQVKYFNRGKQSHKSIDCRLPKRNEPKEANVVVCITNDVSNIDLIDVISKVNLMGSNPKEWWIYTDATHHVCLDMKMFSTFEPIKIGERCSWGTLPLHKQGPRKGGPEDDFWKRSNYDKCLLCA